MPSSPSKILEVFDNPNIERDFIIRIDIPEFTCLCPKTGQPDFATLHLEYIAEQPTSLKLNYYVPGTNLKIVSDDILASDQPDYVLLLAWHLSKPIIKKWKTRGLKSKFIVPLPTIEII